MLFIEGCDIFDKQEQIPAYIYISDIKLVENPEVNEGTLSSRIVDAWVFVDDQLIGAFELPCTFPVLMEGKHKIEVHAGIYLNGVRTTRVYYRFYEPWQADIELVPDSILTVEPLVSYSSDIKLPFHETFELGGVLLEDGSKSLTSLEKTNDPDEIFEGNFSGKVVLNDTDSVFQGVSIHAYKLPTSGGDVFLELDYKSEADIIVGVYAIKSAQILHLEVAGILPRNTWGKIYINLSPTVYRHNDAIEFKIFLGSYLPEGMNKATVLIDNIKLIHL